MVLDANKAVRRIGDHRAYRPTAFVDIATATSMAALVVGGYAAGSIGPLLLTPLPLIAWHLLKNYMQPLRKATPLASEEGVLLRFPGPPPAATGEIGVLRVVYDQGRHWNEMTSVEFEKSGETTFSLVDEKTLLLPWGEAFLGVSTDPLVVALYVENAVKIKTSWGPVYVAATRPYDGILVESHRVKAEPTGSGRALRISVPPQSRLYSYAECCGFRTKRVLIAETGSPSEATVRLGLPSHPGFILVPRKPYLPSLAGTLLDSLGFPSSYYAATGEAVLTVELDEGGGRGYIRVRPRPAFEAETRGGRYGG